MNKKKTGCPKSGFYGEGCYQRCPKNCQEDHCHILNGTCLGCVSGYTGPTCNERKFLVHGYGLFQKIKSTLLVIHDLIVNGIYFKLFVILIIIFLLKF